MPRRSARRGRCRRLVLPACVAAICVSGCQLAHRDRGLPTIHSEDRRNSDEDVLNAVLDDLIVDDLFWARSTDGRERFQLILHIQSRRPTAALSEKKIHSEARASKVRVPRDACADLIARNVESVSLSALRPANANVRVEDLSGIDLTRRYKARKEFWERYPNAKGFVQTWLPGYSEDGRTAVVRFRCGPPRDPGDSYGGQVGTYLFSRQNDQWKIQWRMFHPV